MLDSIEATIEFQDIHSRWGSSLGTTRRYSALPAGACPRQQPYRNRLQRFAPIPPTVRYVGIGSVCEQ
jgi:hypothetical protein